MGKRPLVVALTLLAAYFAVMLIPIWVPRFGISEAFSLYALSGPFILVGLAGLFSWGIAAAAVAMIRGVPISERHRAFVILPIAGVLMFSTASSLSRGSIRRALPTGSHQLEFDSATWREPNSSSFVRSEPTPRQKMLGSLIGRLTRGQSRAELEGLLGPSLEITYFQSSGRDLIYILGPQRDSFMAIDSEWLLIWLDDSGRFERFEIAVD